MSKFKKSSGSSFGSWMSVEVKFKGNKVGCCPISDDGIVDTEHVIVVDKSNAPENLFAGKHVVQLAEDKKSIKAFRPYSGQHPGRFLKFASKEGEAPVPRSVKGEYGDYQVFYPIFEITSGQYKGCDASYQVAYKFKEGEDGTTEFNGSKGKFLEQLEEFLDTVIGDFEPPKFSDNLLPLFQKMALRSKREIGIIFKRGRIATLVELEGSNPPWKQEPDKE